METIAAKNWLKNLAIVVLGIIVLGLSIKSCSKDIEINELKLDNADIEQRFIETIKIDSTRSYQQRQLIADKDIAIKLLGEEAKRYRNIKSVTKVEMVYKTDTVFAEYTEHDTIYKLMGREFCSETQYDTICGKIDSLGVIIYPHTTYLGEVNTVIGSEKSGFLKLKSNPIVNISFSNPNVRISSMSNVVVNQPKPKRLAWLISGIAIGITGGILLMAN
jgi:uncharacterized lipoprotein YehR (DUF1307 family)